MLTHLNRQPTPPARVLLLGAGGFMAQHLRRLLAARGINCRACGRPELDLTAPDAAAKLSQIVEPTDTVVMLAALTPDKGRGYTTFLANVRMAETVCETLQDKRCAHFIYLSSDAVYDAHKIPLDEDSTREPIDLYALTHTAREMMLKSVLAKTDTPFCILRPTNIYGPGDTHNNYGPNRFVRTAVEEKRIVLFGKGEERRSHLYIADAVDLVSRVIHRRSTGALNLAAKPAVSFATIARKIVGISSIAVQIEYAPRTVSAVHRPYKPTQVFRYLYNLGREIGPVVHRPYFVGAIFDAFPDFEYTPLETGLTAHLEFIRAEKSAPRSP